MARLDNIDINLLKTLNQLLKDNNVSKAAKSLNLSQPTVSLQLGKLRDFFDDPLFIPGPRGMRPTSKAELMKEKLQKALVNLEESISFPQVFIPAESTRLWNFVASDYCENSILLPIVKQLSSESYSFKYAVLGDANSKMSVLDKEHDIDLFFHVREDVDPNYRCRTLFSDRYVLVSRVGHPLQQKAPSLKDFIGLNFVIVSPDGGGFFGDTDKILSQLGLSRNISLSVPHFMFALNIVLETDLVAMLPYKLVQDNPKVQIHKSPIDIPPFEINMFWREEKHKDLGHQWLRNYVLETISCTQKAIY